MINATLRNHVGKMEVSDPLPLRQLLTKLSHSDIFRHLHDVNVIDVTDDTSSFCNRIGSCKILVGDQVTHYVKVVGGDDADSINMISISERFPGLFSDDRVCSPFIVCVLDKNSGEIIQYIHVMRWITNQGTLATVLVDVWMSGNIDRLRSIMTSFGEFLRNIHMTYPKLQHNDMNPSNVLVTGGTFVLVDCAGFDDEVGDDVRTMVTCLETMAEEGLGESFRAVCTESFLRGYSCGQ